MGLAATLKNINKVEEKRKRQEVNLVNLSPDLVEFVWNLVTKLTKSGHSTWTNPGHLLLLGLHLGHFVILDHFPELTEEV